LFHLSLIANTPADVSERADLLLVVTQPAPCLLIFLLSAEVGVLARGGAVGM